MTNYNSSYYAEIGGDFKGIQGDISGGIINQYIITQKSGLEITSQRLIPGSPYLGLRKFEVDDKDKFFGRDRWIIELTNYLARENVLLLLGASGSGKSSLIQAGLIPKLKDQWGSQLFNFTFVPDVDPFESFYGCLLSKYKQSEAKLARTVKEDTLIQVVQALKSDAQWLIFIDQFEEVFTRTPKTERDIFIKSLIQLIENSDSSVKVIMTMRADFLDKLSPYPDLGKVHDSSSRMLTDMEDSDLRLAIAEPAARNGVIFEQGLIDTIIADFHQQAGSLPLLQYTLNLLWSKDDITDRVLNTKTYQELGGVTGALQQQADYIYYHKFINETQRKLAKEIFLELIELVGKEAVSRRADKAIFERDEIQKEVLYQLIDSRLLVSKGEDGKATVEVAHEALLRSWKVLQDLIREKEEIIILRNRLYADAKQWNEIRQQDSQKANGELWNGSKLAKVVQLYNNKSFPNLDTVAKEFINASINYLKQLKAIEAERQRREVNTELSLANSLGRYSLSLFNEGGKELDVFIEAIKAGKILQKHKASDTKVIDALQKVLADRMEYNRLVGHYSSVTSVSFSPDGKTLASGSRDDTIKLWNVETGKEIRTLSGHNESVSSVSFSSDGKTLASGSWDKTIKLWNVETGEEIRTLTGYQDYVNSVSFSSDSKTLASGGNDSTIKLWNVETGQEIRTLTGHNESVSSVSFSSDGKTLASGSEDKTIKLWNVETGQEIRTLTGHNESVQSVSFSSDGKTLASGSYDNTIKLWNVETGQEIRTLTGHNDRVYSVSFSPDGKTLASGSGDDTIKLWNVETGKEIRTLTGHNYYVYSVSFSSDGKTLASGSVDKTIKLWNVETGKEIRTLSGHNDYVSSVSFSSDGKTLASGSWDDTIKLWNLETGKEIRTLKGHDNYVNGVSFSPDGKTLASGSTDKTIKLWNLETGKEIRTLTGHNDYVSSVSFSSDGKTLASGSGDNTIKLWNVETGQEIRTLTGHNESVSSVSFSSDGKTLASGSYDNTIKLWNVETGQEIRTLTGHNDRVYSVSFSSDGKTLASGSGDNNTIKLWNVETGKEIRTLTGHNFEVYSVSFSPDDKILASGSNDNDDTIKLWNVETGKEIRTLKEYNSYVKSVSFSGDGKILASGSGDGTVKLWKRNTGWDLDALMGRSCDWVRAYLHNPNSDVKEEDRHLCDGIGTK
jgi:WD40 repeat protein/energy-coupling factor transporter ATP-binding protein EcfA2